MHLYLNKTILFFGHVIFNFRQQKSLRQGSHNVNSMGEGAGGSGEGNGEGEGGKGSFIATHWLQARLFYFCHKEEVTCIAGPAGNAPLLPPVVIVNIQILAMKTHKKKFFFTFSYLRILRNKAQEDSTMATPTKTIIATTDQSPPPTVNREVVIVTSILIFMLGFVGNAFICFGFCRFRQLRSLTNYFVLNLSIADLLLVTALAGWIIHDLRGNPPDEKILIALLINIDVLCFSTSMLNMMTISLDRYCAVVYPLQYPHIITKSRACVATFLIWAYSLAMAGIGVSRFFTDAMENSDKIFLSVLSTVNFVIPAVVMVLTHLSIFRIAWNAKQRSMADLGGIEGVHNMKELLLSLKLSFNTLVILFPMVTAWGIFYGITVSETLWPTQIQLSAGFSIAVGLLPHIAAAIDPIVYILVTRDLRRKLCHF